MAADQKKPGDARDDRGPADPKTKSDPRDARPASTPGPRADPHKADYDPHFDPHSPSYDPRYHPEDPTRHQHASPKSAKAGTPSAESRASAAKGVKGEHGDYPKPFVRAKPGAGGWTCEIRMVADSDGEQVAKDEGFAAVEQPERLSGFVEYPKWKYHADGRSQLVQGKAEEDALDGFDDLPPEPADDVPALVNPPAGTASKNRPPVPADRG